MFRKRLVLYVHPDVAFYFQMCIIKNIIESSVLYESEGNSQNLFRFVFLNTIKQDEQIFIVDQLSRLFPAIK